MSENEIKKEAAIKAAEILLGIPREEIFKKSKSGKAKRNAEFVMSRRIISVMLKQRGFSLKGVAKAVGNKDHTTVINSLQKHQNYMETDKEYRETWERYKEIFNNMYNSLYEDQEYINQKHKSINAKIKYHKDQIYKLNLHRPVKPKKFMIEKNMFSVCFI
jgi:hypothetical protein